MYSDNIFSALAKYNSAIDENYLTESFIYIVNTLLSRERTLGIEILNKLCFENSNVCFTINENIYISTQDMTEQGIPDIKISSPDKLIYIEVKRKSDVGYRQIERYKEALLSSSASIKCVNLITRDPIDFKTDEEKPHKHIRWYEVYNWLDTTRKGAKDAVSIYIIQEFMVFLEVKQMTIQKVGWEYINGVPALVNLMNMIEIAIQRTALRIYKRQPSWWYIGYYVENSDYFCGIFYDEPSVIKFELSDRNKFDKNLIKKTSNSFEDKEMLRFRLPLEDNHFFSLNKDDQVDMITNFLKTAYEDAQRMRIK